MRRGKYNVAPKEERTLDGIVFDSKKEMQDYQRFSILLRAGQIIDLQRQVKIPLFAGRNPSGELAAIANYVCDFVVTEQGGTVRYYDSKGVRTQMYRLKKKWAEFCHNITITEI